MATRSAIEGGLHPETAYTLSDLYIQKIESTKHAVTLNDLIKNALIDFAERVAHSQQQSYTQVISACQQYIFRHVYDRISLEKLAQQVAMNPSYLSTRFNQEVGVSISTYIQQAKINEAKYLLTFTHYTISKIGSLLCFNDQSYFTKVFKTFEHTTPKQYKNHHTMFTK